MSMDIYAERGHKVLVSKVSAHNGYDHHEEEVAELLKIGQIYTIDHTDVGGSSTSIYLEEFPNKAWNSVNFIDYVYSPQEKDFKEPNKDGKKELTINREAYEFAVRKFKRHNKEQFEARAMFKEGVIKLGDSEMIVDYVHAFDKECNGCLRHNKDIMLTYKVEGKETIYDLFLTYEQAKSLYDEIDTIFNKRDNE